MLCNTCPRQCGAIRHGKYALGRLLQNAPITP